MCIQIPRIRLLSTILASSPSKPKMNGSPVSISKPHFQESTKHSTIASETKASYERSQSVKHITRTVHGARSSPHNTGSLPSNIRHRQTKSKQQPATNEADDGTDYANLTESGVPLIGNVEGLKLSKARKQSKTFSPRSARPLPDIPTAKSLEFTVGDLPRDFKGKLEPSILIEGCVNYSACVSCLLLTR